MCEPQFDLVVFSSQPVEETFCEDESSAQIITQRRNMKHITHSEKHTPELRRLKTHQQDLLKQKENEVRIKMKRRTKRERDKNQQKKRRDEDRKTEKKELMQKREKE